MLGAAAAAPPPPSIASPPAAATSAALAMVACAPAPAAPAPEKILFRSCTAPMVLPVESAPPPMGGSGEPGRCCTPGTGGIPKGPESGGGIHCVGVMGAPARLAKPPQVIFPAPTGLPRKSNSAIRSLSSVGAITPVVRHAGASRRGKGTDERIALANHR